MIDAHQHFWRLHQNDCVWPTPDLAAIHRDFELAELKSVAAPLGVRGSVLVQSQPSVRDTDYLLDLAASDPFILGVVGWTELKAPDAPARIRDLAGRPKLAGLRPMLQSMPEDDWIADPALDAAIDAMVEHGLVLDALVFTRHLPHLALLIRRRPELKVVIDHGAKPPIAAGELDPWRERMSALAEAPEVACKLSGLLTEAAPGQGDAELAPYVDHLVRVFGPERLIFGSDWPVLNLASDYAGWLAMAKRLTAPLGVAAQALIFGGVAARAYGLPQAAI
jgi:L-fuconolactonase